MTDPSPSPEASASATYSLGARFRDVIWAPAALFDWLAQTPRWLDVLVVVSLITGASAWLLWNSDVGRSVVANEQTKVMAIAKARLTEAQLQQVVEQMAQNPVTPARMAMRMAASMFMGPLVMALVCHVVFGWLLLAPTIRYVQVLSVISHASCIGLLQQLFLHALSRTSGSLSTSTSVPHLLPFLAWPSEGSLAAAGLQLLDPFSLWWVGIVSLGLARVYRASWWPFGVVLTLALALFGLLHVLMEGARGSGGGGHGFGT